MYKKESIKIAFFFGYFFLKKCLRAALKKMLKVGLPIFA